MLDTQFERTAHQEILGFCSELAQMEMRIIEIAATHPFSTEKEDPILHAYEIEMQEKLKTTRQWISWTRRVMEGGVLYFEQHGG